MTDKALWSDPQGFFYSWLIFIRNGDFLALNALIWRLFQRLIE
ncbi:MULTISPECIES: hypothetical protein [unclassified Serratia (in: enterobacteria)]|nr:hypothetical protein [Serratia sp. C2(2)]MEE4445457.1 hypothetical protein [Serratia sp. C2(1)]